MKFNIHEKQNGKTMIVFPKESDTVDINFNNLKRDGEFIKSRMIISYDEDDKLYYAVVYSQDEDGYFTDHKVSLSFEKLELSQSAEDNTPRYTSS